MQETGSIRAWHKEESNTGVHPFSLLLWGRRGGEEGPGEHWRTGLQSTGGLVYRALEDWSREHWFSTGLALFVYIYITFYNLININHFFKYNEFQG